MSGVRRSSLRQELPYAVLLAVFALLGLRVASWEPRTVVDTGLAVLSWAMLFLVALWLVLVAGMLLRYDLPRWLRGRR